MATETQGQASTSSKPHNNPRHNQNAAEWGLLKTMEDASEEPTLVVTIQKLPLDRPKYSTRWSVKRPDGKVGPFIPVFVQAQGTVRVTSQADRFFNLQKAAEAYISQDAQDVEDNFVDKRAAREARSMDSGDETRRTGKTDRERQKSRSRQAEEV